LFQWGVEAKLPNVADRIASWRSFEDSNTGFLRRPWVDADDLAAREVDLRAVESLAQRKGYLASKAPAMTAAEKDRASVIPGIVNGQRAEGNPIAAYKALSARWAELLGWYDANSGPLKMPELRSLIEFWKEFQKDWENKKSDMPIPGAFLTPWTFWGAAVWALVRDDHPVHRIIPQNGNLAVAESNAINHGYVVPAMIMKDDGNVTRDASDMGKRTGANSPLATSPHEAAKKQKTQPVVVKPLTGPTIEKLHPISTKIDRFLPGGSKEKDDDDDKKKDPFLAAKLLGIGVGAGLALAIAAKLFVKLGDAGASSAVDEIVKARDASPGLFLSEAIEVHLGRGGGGSSGGHGHGGGGGHGWGGRGAGRYWGWGGGGAWWGASDWDDYCANCYGPFCLCGADAVERTGDVPTTKTCASCGAAWVPFRRLGDAGTPSWYVSELVKLRQEQRRGTTSVSDCFITPEEDREVVRRMGLEGSEVAPFEASNFRAAQALLDVGAEALAFGILPRAVRDRTYEAIRWVDVPGPDGMTMYVGADMLRAPVPDGTVVRLPVTWDETKSVARMLSEQIGEDLIAPSKTLADAVYAAAPIKTVYISPVKRLPSGATLGLSTVEDAKAHSANIDRQIARKGGTIGDFHAGAEKYWLLDRRLDPDANKEFLSRTNIPAPTEPMAMNYGGWNESGKPQQPVSGAHNYVHADVSQLYRPWKRWARGKDGSKVDLLKWIERREGVSPAYTAAFKGPGEAVT
jgi:hypothetical protein